MADSTSSPEAHEGPGKSIFPLTEESVNRSLMKISSDPEKALIEEIGAIKLSNPTLLLGLRRLQETSIKPDEGIFTEGALWTHKIVREQAEMLGRKVPLVSLEVWQAHIHDQMETVEQSKNDPNAGRFDHTMQQIKKISAQDPEFGKALKRITLYRMAGLGNFYLGVANAYLPVKKAFDSEQLEKNFYS